MILLSLLLRSDIMSNLTQWTLPPFLVPGLPNYEPGHGNEASLNMLFSAAYKSGSSFEIRFVSDAQGNKKKTFPNPS